MKKQSKGKKRIILSGVAVLTTLALLAGGTMAWFTDTERIGADFQAGVLDIEVSTSTDGPITQDMTFTNLRPMELESFEAELNGTDFEGKAADEIVNPNTDGFDPLPVYFHPVTVTNVGSLPAQVRFTMEDAGPCNGTIANLVDNGFGGVKPGDPAQVDCEDKYNLKDVLKVYVYEKVDDTWQRVPDVNLNAESCEGSEKSYYLPFDSTDPLGAGADTVTYVIGGLSARGDHRKRLPGGALPRRIAGRGTPGRCAPGGPAAGRSAGGRRPVGRQRPLLQGLFRPKFGIPAVDMGRSQACL